MEIKNIVPKQIHVELELTLDEINAILKLQEVMFIDRLRGNASKEEIETYKKCEEFYDHFIDTLDSVRENLE